MARKKRKSPQWYKAAVKHLRHYSNVFDPADGYDLRYIRKWTPAQKAKVTRTMELVNKLQGQPHKVYRPRKKERLKEAQRFAHDEVTKVLNVAFIPVADPSKPANIRFKKDKITITQHGVKRAKVDIDYDLLTADPDAALDMAFEAAKADAYTIQAGLFEIGVTFTDEDLLKEKIQQLMHKYGTSNYNPENPNSSHYKNWMHGIIAFYFDKNQEWGDFRAARARARAEHKRKLKAHYARMKRLKAKAQADLKKQRKK